MRRSTRLVVLALGLVLADLALARPAQAADSAAGAAAEDSLPGDGTAVKGPPKWGAGMRMRYVFVPSSVLNLFLDHSTSMNSFGIGAEVILRRRPDFDIVFGIEYDGASPEDGLYQEKGDDPSVPGQYPDYTNFDGLAMLGVDASFIWHTEIASGLELRYGAGIGIGFILGDIIQTDTMCPNDTTLSDLDDPNHCDKLPGPLNTEVADKPPVLPIVNLLFGLRYKPTERFAINLETGFRNMFFLGLGAEYMF